MRFLTLLGILVFGAALLAIHSVAAFAVVVALAANAEPHAAAPTPANEVEGTEDAEDAERAGVELAEAAAIDADAGLARLVVRPIELTIARPYAEDVVVFETPWWVVLYWVAGVAAIALATLLCAVGMWSLGGRAKVRAGKAGKAESPAAPATSTGSAGSAGAARSPGLGQH